MQGGFSVNNGLAHDDDPGWDALWDEVHQVIAYLGQTPAPVRRDAAPVLPPQTAEDQGRITLVLDLDETLVHCSPDRLGTSPDCFVRFDDTSAVGCVYCRPFAKLFLEITAQFFEVVIFTASTPAYADQVLDVLDPRQLLVRHRLYRQHCTVVDGGYMKDLSQLGRRLESVVLVDNSPISLVLNPDNGILCSTWLGDAQDKELLDLLAMLRTLEGDVQQVLEARYGLRKYFSKLKRASEAAGVLQ